MTAILSRGCFVPAHGFGLRRLVFAAALLLPTMFLADAARAQDLMQVGRDAVRAWTLHHIAVTQAASGDMAGAKNTVAQIDEPDYICGTAEVTGVWFCNGQPLYDHPLAPAGWSQFDRCGSPMVFNRDQAPHRVPATPPQGLPSNYLAPDPRHGAVVNFSDECDSFGTRVTSRRYADGYAVIETPRSDKNGR